MKKPTDLLCGIDIGSDAIRAVLARAPESGASAPGDPESIEIVALGQADAANAVQYGEVVRQGGVTAAVRRAVEEAEQTAGAEVGSAWVSVGSRSRRSINSSGTVTILEPGRPISERDVHRAVQAAIPSDGGVPWLRPPYELLHALPQEFWVDDLDATDDPTGWTGRNIQSFVHLVTCPRSSLQGIEEAVNGAGIIVEQLVLAPLAAGQAVLDPEERQGDVAVLDIGAMTTDIAVFRRGVLWHSDVMPSGGRAYTKDIALGLRTSHASAEEAKRRFGAALVESVPEDDHFEIQVSGGAYPQLLPRRLLADVVQQRAESDFTKVRDQLRKALSTGIPGHLVLTGGGSNLDGLGEVARFVFGAEAETRGARSLVGLRDQAEHSQFAAAVGLCRYGLKQRRRALARRASSSPSLAQVRRLFGSRLRRVTRQLRKAQ